MTFLIKTIHHSEQRYNTAGDYETKDGSTEIRVSELGNEDMEFLIAIHELVESYLCKQAGVTDDEIDEFDFIFNGRSPGDDPTAPYHRQHVLATEIEKKLAAELGIDWVEYDAKITALMEGYKK